MFDEIKKGAISISTATIFKSILAVILFIFLFRILDVVFLILLAVVIASAVEPAVDVLAKIHIKRTFAVFLIYLIAFLLLGLVFYFFIPALISEAANVLAQLPHYLDVFQGWLTKSGLFINKKLPFIEPNHLSISNLALQAKDYLAGFSSGAFSTALNIFGGFFRFGLVIILSFYLSIQKNGIDDFLRIVTPVKNHQTVLNLWKRTQGKISKWFQGQIVLMLIIGVLVFLALSVLNIKHAFLFAVMAGVFEIIPIFGPLLAAIPSVLVALAQGGLTLGLLVVGIFFIIQQFENHLIYPMVFKKLVGIPSIVVILSFIIGGEVGGFLGVILSVPIAAFVMELAHHIERRRETRTQVVPEIDMPIEM